MEEYYQKHLVPFRPQKGTLLKITPPHKNAGNGMLLKKSRAKGMLTRWYGMGKKPLRIMWNEITKWGMSLRIMWNEITKWGKALTNVHDGEKHLRMYMMGIAPHTSPGRPGSRKPDYR